MVGAHRWIHVVSVTVMVGVALGLLAAPVSASTAQFVDVVLPPECKYTRQVACARRERSRCSSIKRSAARRTASASR